MIKILFLQTFEVFLSSVYLFSVYKHHNVYVLTQNLPFISIIARNYMLGSY